MIVYTDVFFMLMKPFDGLIGIISRKGFVLIAPEPQNIVTQIERILQKYSKMVYRLAYARTKTELMLRICFKRYSCDV